MKIEVGKTYLSRAGEKVTINTNNVDSCYPFCSTCGRSYTIYGDYWLDGTRSNNDLVSEVADVAAPEPSLDNTYKAAYMAAMTMGADHAKATDVAERIESLLE